MKPRFLSTRLMTTGLLSTAAVGLTSCTSSAEVVSTSFPTSPSCATQATVSGVGPSSRIDGQWTSVFIDNFDRCDLGDDWGAYSGSPGGNPEGRWEPEMVSVGDGTLRLGAQLTDDGWVTGGVSNHPVTQQYGRWEVRMRADPSADLSYHMLLWPQNEQWPPEIDFAESVAPHREAMSAFLHWKDGDDADAENRKTHATTQGDFTRWHTVGVEWAPGVVRYLLDGKVWAQAHSDTMTPDTPMWLGMQVEAGSCERREDWGLNPCGPDEPRPTSAAVEVDWVAVYESDRPIEDLVADGYFAPTSGAFTLTED